MNLGHIAVILCVISLASAFHLGDHKTITTNEFSECFPGSKLLSHLDEMVRANQAEDINIWNKWVKGYAHFYNPYRQVKVCFIGWCRSSSDVRVRMLEAELKNTGAVIHHIQDMASPGHVVPVMHGTSDGFENNSRRTGYSNKQYPSRSIDCQGLQAKYKNFVASSSSPMMAILNMTSIATLRTLQNTFTYQLDGRQVTGNWTVFWDPIHLDKNNFGQYGPAGNNFGAKNGKFTANGHTYVIDPTIFEEYKRNQLRLAIDATKLAFVYSHFKLGNKVAINAAK